MCIPDRLALDLGLVSLLENMLLVATTAKDCSCPTCLHVGCPATSILLVSGSSVLGTSVALLLEVSTLATQAAMAQQLANVLNLLTCGSWVSSLCLLAAIAADLDLCIFSVLWYHSIVTQPKA